MWTTRSKEAIKASIFETLRSLNADYAEVDYSGGNDEGGVDDIVIYRHIEGADGEERLKLELPHEESRLDHDFNELLSLDFGTWAGEFEAWGTVYADLRQNKVWRSGSQSVMEEDSDAGEY